MPDSWTTNAVFCCAREPPYGQNCSPQNGRRHRPHCPDQARRGMLDDIAAPVRGSGVVSTGDLPCNPNRRRYPILRPFLPRLAKATAFPNTAPATLSFRRETKRLKFSLLNRAE